ncbi:MAG: riboflavin synthase [Opitutae bacterium]|nr:riboflavin synthase [Opitutae bacterium]MCD8299221.1 riboflavin synthase [Opitutae bacterium]
MFTGLIETTGTVISLEKNAAGIFRLTIDAPKFAGSLKIGDSVANNGCCLTVVDVAGTHLGFDVLEETLRRTSFSLLKPGSAINLERSLQADARLGGHFVTGHVDATGTIVSLRQEGANFRLCVRPPEEFRKYLVYKGSVAVDGISLTVAALDDAAGTFDIWLIPHTMQETNLRERAAGEPVNLEFDILAKYVERLQTSSK